MRGRRSVLASAPSMLALSMTIVSVLLFLTLTTFPTASSSQIQSITLTPMQGAPGAQIQVVGTGFGAGENIQIYFGPTPVAIALTNPSGAFVVYFAVPTNATAGRWSVTAIGTTTGLVASASFTVTGISTSSSSTSSSSSPEETTSSSSSSSSSEETSGTSTTTTTTTTTTTITSTVSSTTTSTVTTTSEVPTTITSVVTITSVSTVSIGAQVATYVTVNRPAIDVLVSSVSVVGASVAGVSGSLASGMAKEVSSESAKEEESKKNTRSTQTNPKGGVQPPRIDAYELPDETTAHRAGTKLERPKLLSSLSFVSKVSKGTIIALSAAAALSALAAALPASAAYPLAFGTLSAEAAGTIVAIVGLLHLRFQLRHLSGRIPTSLTLTVIAGILSLSIGIVILASTG